MKVSLIKYLLCIIYIYGWSGLYLTVKTVFFKQNTAIFIIIWGYLNNEIITMIFDKLIFIINAVNLFLLLYLPFETIIVYPLTECTFVRFDVD